MEQHNESLLAGHFELTDTERGILTLLGQGLTDALIAEALPSSKMGVRSGIRRFRDRTGLSGRELVAWAGHHELCCIALSK